MIANVHRKIDGKVHQLMRMIRRRVTIDGPPVVCNAADRGESKFRVEVWSTASDEPIRVYQCSQLGHIEVEELDCGDIHLIGRTSSHDDDLPGQQTTY